MRTARLELPRTEGLINMRTARLSLPRRTLCSVMFQALGLNMRTGASSTRGAWVEVEGHSGIIAAGGGGGEGYGGIMAGGGG